MSLPAIAAGANTIWEHFETPEGQLAAVIVQTGIEERETDLSREVSGATAIVCLDSQNADSLDRCIARFLL